MLKPCTVALLLACASAAYADQNAPGALKITAASDARTVLRGIPEEAVTERFEVLDANGVMVGYAGLAEGPVGGVVFKDGKLHGTLTRAQAETFYSCRGHATARQHYWAQEADGWIGSLLASAQPAEEVELVFSGKSTSKSIKAVLEDPAFSQVSTLVSMGTNPLNVVKALSKVRREQRQHDADARALAELGKIAPGDTEKRLADAVRPQDLTFLDPGLVLAYPKYSVEFMVREGTVQTVQQPSFVQVARVNPALFYSPDLSWGSCSPGHWQEAIPKPAAM